MSRLRIAGVVLVVMVGCSQSGSEDWVPSDIDEQATLESVGAAGYGRLCSSFEDYVRDQYRSQLLVKAACTAHALDTTSDAVACGAVVDDCIDTLPPVVETQLEQILDQASCTRVEISATGCKAKVLQLKSCLDALGELVDEVELSATCAAVGSPVPDNWWKIPTPSACQSLNADC